MNLEIFDALAKATAGRKQIRFNYRKPGRAESEPRLVDPYHLANINGEWFLFAHDQARKDIRTFAPARISAVELTGKTFARPQKFSVEKRLRDSFGVHSGEGEFEVVLRFSEFAADYIREKMACLAAVARTRQRWLGAAFETFESCRVQRWVLGWGGHATVVQPPELIESVQRAAEALLKTCAG